MSLGKDLATIRKGLGLTLEEIQNAIKIPTHILKSIEDDSIYDSEEHNTTYIRSFIRSYARGLKIDDDKVVAALELAPPRPDPIGIFFSTHMSTP